jgi:hypothetical protein
VSIQPYFGYRMLNHSKKTSFIGEKNECFVGNTFRH